MSQHPAPVNPPPCHTRHANLLTIVIEDYFQVGAFSGLIPAGNWDRFESRLRRGTGAVLQMLADTGNRATFFTCGWIADHHPEVLREVAAGGHELACQGYFQHSVFDLAPAALREDLRRSRTAVEQATGRAVHGHRIGRGWLRPRDLWVLEAIREAGFDYDSSICPVGRDFARHPEFETVRAHTLAHGPLHEVPISSQRLAGLHIPIAGGNWFRQAPDRPLRGAARRWIRGRETPLVAYFHTWEFDPQQPRIAGANALQRVRHYRNLASMPYRLRCWLDEFRFVAVAEHLALVPRVVTAAAPPAPSRPPLRAPELPATATPLTVVVPCFNEAPTLQYLSNTLRRFSTTGGADLELHLVLVDDGSGDGTWALMRATFAQFPRCTLLRHPSNRGLAAALLTGFTACRTDLVAVIDADCTFDPAQLPAMLELMTEGVDVVAASPAHAAGAMRNVPPWRVALSRGAAALYRCVLRQPLTSYTSCFRIYRRDTVAGLALSDPGFCGVAEILGRLDLTGHRIIEYPALLDTRVLGQSKIRVLRTVAGHLVLLARLAAFRWLGRPLPARVRAMPQD